MELQTTTDDSRLAIKTENLTFSFQNSLRPVVSNINLEVPTESIYGFLGPNGAGKTTTIKLLLGLIRHPEAKITILNRDIYSHRVNVLQDIGAIIEQPALYGHLTARENLEITRLSYGCSKANIEHSLRLTGLLDAADRKVKEYSLGMKQRLGIATAVLHEPKLIILDEPTNGLDPAGIVEIRELVTTLNKEHGVTILISSHLLPEIEKLASYLGIINRGELVFQGTLTQLRNKSHAGTITLRSGDNFRAMKLLQSVYTCRENNGEIKVEIFNREQIPAIARELVLNNIDLHHLSLQDNELEQLFLETIGEV